MEFTPPSLCELSLEMIKKDQILNHKTTIDFFTKSPPYCFYNDKPIEKWWKIELPNRKVGIIKSEVLKVIEDFLAIEFYSINPPSV